jgi:hypothetical protein
MFKKGNKLGVGGRKPGAGRKTKLQTEYDKAIKQEAEALFKERLETELNALFDSYFKLAKGRMVDHHCPKTGVVLWSEIEVEPSILRHAIDRVAPARAAEDQHGNAAPLIICEHPKLESD